MQTMLSQGKNQRCPLQGTAGSDLSCRRQRFRAPRGRVCGRHLFRWWPPFAENFGGPGSFPCHSSGFITLPSPRGTHSRKGGLFEARQSRVSSAAFAEAEKTLPGTIGYCAPRPVHQLLPVLLPSREGGRRIISRA